MSKKSQRTNAQARQRKRIEREMAAELSFFDGNGQPRLRKAYCVFMDVLGFRNVVSESYRRNRARRLLNRFYTVASEQVRALNPDPDYPAWSVSVFTDNIVLGCPLRTEDGEDEFATIYPPIARYQLAMALAGFFVRGGMAVGEMFMDKSIVYGPALFEAYRLESEIACDPRIVLSDEASELVEKQIAFYSPRSEAPHNVDLLRDADGRIFVNYLAGLVREADEPSLFTQGLVEHKTKIVKRLAKYRSKPEVWGKYRWLADYHNSFCFDVQQVPGFTNDCMIQSDHMKTVFHGVVNEESS